MILYDLNMSNYMGVSPSVEVDNVKNCDIFVSELLFYVYFPTITQRKNMQPLFLLVKPAWAVEYADCITAEG